METRCPKCKTPLLPNASKCDKCTWTQAEGGTKCLCGRLARINYQGFKCWDCYYQTIHNTEREDWRDKTIREHAKQNDLMPKAGEPEWAYRQRMKKYFLGGMAGLLKAKTS